MMKLDAIDQKILAALMQNARINLTELATLIHHSYGVVWKRTNKLLYSGVIRHVYPVVQYPGIGARRYMSVYLTLKNATDEEQARIIAKLGENPYLIHVNELQGKWSISVLLVTNYLKEAKEAIEYIQDLCGAYMTELTCMPTFTIHTLNHHFFSNVNVDLGKSKTGYYDELRNTPLVHLSTVQALSEKEIEILDYLKLHGRDSLEEIGKAIDLDPKLVDYNIKKLISKNLIRRFLIELDHTKLGYEQYILFLNLRGKPKDEIIKYLKQSTHAHSYFEYLDYWELAITFTVKNRAEMYTLFNDLQKTFKDVIRNHEIVWLVKKWKVEPYPDVKRVYREKM